MAEGIVRPPQSNEMDTGSAGIFVERAGNRKMAMGGGRLVLPRLFPFQAKNRPIVEEGDILRRNGAEQAPGAYVSPDSEMESPPKQSFVTCSQCGTSQEWLHDGPFHCPYCQVKKSGDIVLTSDLPRGLHSVEEGDHSEVDEELDGHRTPPRSSSPSQNTMRHSPMMMSGGEESKQFHPETSGTGRLLSNFVRIFSGGGRRSRAGSAEDAYPGHDAHDSNQQDSKST